MKNLLNFFLFLILIAFQVESSAQCIGKSKGSSAELGVELFLTLPDTEKWRIETGATNEAIEQIKVIENNLFCSNIENILNSDDELRPMNAQLHPDRAKYFYQTNNYYFAFWGFHPRFDDIPKTGPKSMFVVIKKDFSKYWKYYF